MLVLSDIEIHEHRLKVDSLDAHSFLVLTEDGLKHLPLFLVEFQVFATSLSGDISGYSSNLGQRILLDAIDSESLVNGGTEALVIDHV
jgi:hypothetical protein